MLKCHLLETTKVYKAFDDPTRPSKTIQQLVVESTHHEKICDAAMLVKLDHFHPKDRGENGRVESSP